MRLARTLLLAVSCGVWAGPAIAQPAPPQPVLPQPLPVQPGPAPAAGPAVDADRLAAAHELIEASGASAVVTNVLTLMRGQMITAIQQGTSKSRDEVTAIVDELLLPEMKSRVGELTDSLAVIYARSFSTDEMHQLVAFYRSPLGAKLISTAPQMAMQGMAAGQAWGRQVALDALRKNADELRKRGVKL